MLNSASRPSSQRIGRFFSLKSGTYSADAAVQKKILLMLFAMLDKLNLRPSHTVDLGCGIGLWEEISREKGFEGTIWCLDLSSEALRMVPSIPGRHRIQADITSPPLPPGVCDLAVCASVLQWVADPHACLHTIRGLLSRQGVLAFSFFTQGSFKELESLRASFGLESPVSFPSALQWETMLKQSGLSIVDALAFSQVRYFTDANSALQSLSRIGATATSGKRLSRKELVRFCQDYERQYRTSEGVPLSAFAYLGLARKDVR